MKTPSSQFDIYLEPEKAGSLDSLEGVPVCESDTLAGEGSLKYGWQRAVHRKLGQVSLLIPGLALAAVLALAGVLLAPWLATVLFGFDKSVISPILLTIVMGLAIRNLVGLPVAFQSGLIFCVKRVLRIGVALLGLRLSLTAVGQIGFQALPVVIGGIATALFFVLWLSKRVGLPHRLGSLIAVGTSICGVSAIVATGPALNARDDEIGYSVAVITLFGTLALLAYPFLSYWIFSEDPRLAGFFLGAAIHDTSQVAGAGLMYQLRYDAPVALDVATTTKLVRNLCMGAVIPLMAVWARKRTGMLDDGPATTRRLGWSQWVPLFVVGFVVMAALRSVGDLGDRAFGLVERSTWERVLQSAASTSVFFLTLAMASVGLGTNLTQFRKLGWKPLGVGLAAAVVAGLVSVALIRLTDALL
ncbi:MAG: YeiH family protein [Opitutaceae bacterium]